RRYGLIRVASQTRIGKTAARRIATCSVAVCGAATRSILTPRVATPDVVTSFGLTVRSRNAEGAVIDGTRAKEEEQRAPNRTLCGGRIRVLVSCKMTIVEMRPHVDSSHRTSTQ